MPEPSETIDNFQSERPGVTRDVDTILQEVSPRSIADQTCELMVDGLPAGNPPLPDGAIFPPSLPRKNPDFPTILSDEERAAVAGSVREAFEGPLRDIYTEMINASRDPSDTEWTLEGQYRDAVNSFNLSLNSTLLDHNNEPLTGPDDRAIRVLGGQESRTGSVRHDGHVTAGIAQNLGIHSGSGNTDGQDNLNRGENFTTPSDPIAALISSIFQLPNADLDRAALYARGDGGVLADKNWSLPSNINMILGDVVAQKAIVYGTEGNALSPRSEDGADDGDTKREEWQRGVMPDGTFASSMLLNQLEKKPDYHRPNVKAIEIKLLVLLECEFVRIPAGNSGEAQLTVVPPDGPELKKVLAPERLKKVMEALKDFSETRYDDEAAFQAALSTGLPES